MIIEFKTIHPIMLSNKRTASFCRKGTEFQTAELESNFILIDGSIITPLSNIVFIIGKENDAPQPVPANDLVKAKRTRKAPEKSSADPELPQSE